MYTLSDRLQVEKSFAKSPNPMLFSRSKQTFPKTEANLMSMTRVTSGVVTPKDNTKSNPLARLKVRRSCQNRREDSNLSQCH